MLDIHVDLDLSEHGLVDKLVKDPRFMNIENEFIALPA